jgi:cell division protein FtsI/penicillin-binding protein 2
LPDGLEETLEVYNQISALVDVPATRAVADAVGRDVRSIDELVVEGEGIAPFRPVVIAVDVEREVAMTILENKQNLPGVDVDVRSVRSYPSGLATAQIIGYLGPISEARAEELRELGLDPAFDRIGYAGIEAFFQEELAGTNGSETFEVDVAGRQLELVNSTDHQSGYSIQLTIDLDLQNAAQRALVNRINTINLDPSTPNSDSGVVIAMNPQTGEILAMVSWPSYDNSRFARSIDGDYYFELADDPRRPLVNHAISSLYPPGSVWKIITSVAVVEEGVILPNTTLDDPGRLSLPNAYAPNDPGQAQTFVCWLRTGHGPQALLDAIANSCDVYFYQVGGGNPDVSPARLRPGGLGIDDLYRWASAFGIGSQLGIEILGENNGRMPEREWKRRLYGESWSTGDTYNAAFGQGYLTVTPLQLITAISGVINDGTMMQPTLIRQFEDDEGNIVSVGDRNGNVVEAFTPQISRTLVEPPAGEPWTLLIQEDMILQGGASLACRCERDSGFYDETRCNPATYTSQFDRDPDPDDDIHDWVDYRVHVPFSYSWTAGVCDQLSFRLGNGYIPPIGTIDSFHLAQQGMRETVTRGTASASVNLQYPPLAYIDEAGKTGTAEYCDDIARPQGLCIPGRWPSHAWYVGYAPFDNPEIVVVAFVYNGGEGSQQALPIVREVLDYYFRRPPPTTTSPTPAQ